MQVSARLQTDRLDMYLHHEPDPTRPLEETLQALDDVVRTGKVLYIGASNIEACGWRALWISDKRGLRRFDWVQNSFSLLDRSAEREMFPLCAGPGRRIHRVQSARRRVADRKVPRRGDLSRRIADDAASGTVSAFESDDVFRGLAALARKRAAAASR